jgi:general L-amino acid transport system permease protein
MKKVLHKIRLTFFANWIDSLLTLIGVLLIYWIVPPLIQWALIDAAWSGTSRLDCLGDGACWPFIFEKWEQFIYGRYPADEVWRVNLVFLLGVLGITPMLIPAVPYKKQNVIYLLVFFPVVSFVLLSGNWFGLTYVDTTFWGGLLVTLVVAITGNVISLPFGILLALGRRSKMPIVRILSTVYIEFWRGIPLITVLFMASVMLPIFLNEGVTVDKLLRCLIGVALFSSAYMAETVRGGLQALPRGQYEAAKALGLNYWQMMRGIILPQALKIVIPGIVNSFIALFKDTTLVLTVGLFDLLGMIQFNFSDANWSTPQTHYTGYAFAAMMFWIFCFGMSRYSVYMEDRLATDRRAS